MKLCVIIFSLSILLVLFSYCYSEPQTKCLSSLATSSTECAIDCANSNEIHIHITIILAETDDGKARREATEYEEETIKSVRAEVD